MYVISVVYSTLCPSQTLLYHYNFACVYTLCCTIPNLLLFACVTSLLIWVEIDLELICIFVLLLLNPLVMHVTALLIG